MTSNPPKILILADGASFHTERFYNQLKKMGVDVSLASLEEGEQVDTLLERKGRIKQLYYRKALEGSLEIIRQFQPDIISAHYATGYGALAARLNRRTSIPYVLNLWGSDILVVPNKSFMHRRKAISALSRAAHVTADSNYLLSKAGEITSLTKTSVIPWGIEAKYLNLFNAKKDFKQPLKIIVPRMHKAIYNNLFIVDVLSDFIASEKIKITFPAFGPDFNKFRNDASELVGDNIQYYDALNRDDFMPLMAEHDIFLSASSSDSSPVSMIEAMGLGLIPVAAKIDGIKEWLSEQNGYMFELNSRTSLRFTIEKLIKEIGSFNNMRIDNHDKVKADAVFEENIKEQHKILISSIDKK